MGSIGFDTLAAKSALRAASEEPFDHSIDIDVARKASVTVKHAADRELR